MKANNKNTHKRDKGKIDIVKDLRVETQWVKAFTYNERAKALKALAIAKEQERIKMESGNYEAKRDVLRGYHITKKSTDATRNQSPKKKN